MKIEELEEEFAQIREKLHNAARVAEDAARSHVMAESAFVALSKREGEIQRKIRTMREERERAGCDHLPPEWKRKNRGVFTSGRTSISVSEHGMEVEHDSFENYSYLDLPVSVVIQALREMDLV